MVMKCRNCEAENPDDASLCGKCGATLPTVLAPRSANLLEMMTDRGSTWLYVVGIYLGILSIVIPLAYMTNNSAVLGFSFIVWILGGCALLMGWGLTSEQ
jgi:hypothetical protein